jgi:hypothetical protein
MYTFINDINKLKSNLNNHIELELIYLIDNRSENKQKILDNENYRIFNNVQTIDIAKQLIKKYNLNNTTNKIEYTINFITTDGKIRNVPYINGIQQKNNIIYYKKQKLNNNMIFINNDKLPSYKLKISNEKKIPEFDIKDCSFARIKLRYSIIVDNWRLDITLIKNIYNLTNIEEIKDKKNKMFANTNNFVNDAPWNYADKIEFELEYINNLNNFNIKELLVADQIWDDINLFYDNNRPANNNQQKDNQQKDNQQTEYQNIIYKIAKIIIPKKAELYKNKYGIKKLSNQVYDIDKNTFINKLLINIDQYYITDKVDGKRTLILIENNKLYAVSDDLKIIDLKIIRYNTTNYTTNNNNDNTNYNTTNNDTNNDTNDYNTTNNDTNTNNNDNKNIIILDTEYYDGKYYVFDILKFNNELLIYKPFKIRLEYFDKLKKIECLKNIIEYKPFIKLTKKYYEQFKELYEQKKNYETDGFIINPENEKYFDMIVYKLKPIEKSTIDFLIISCPEKLLGIKPYIIKKNMKLYCLICGINKVVSKNLNLKCNNFIEEEIKKYTHNIDYDQYFPIQFETSDYVFPYLFWSDVDLNYKIGEFRLDMNLINNKNNKNNFITSINEYINENKNIWELVKIRDDRNVELKRGNYFGNNYKTADMVWQNYQNPLLIDDIIKPYEYEIYFNFDKDKSKDYKASRAFNSFVKTQIFNNLKNADWCLDLASGNGQDLFRYNKSHVKNLFNLEIDKTALQELNFRKHEFSNNVQITPMNIKSLQLDLNNDYKMNLEYINNTRIKIPTEGFNFIVCNFAFHYLIKNKKYIQNIIKFISSLLKVKGKFIMTAFDGNKIFDLLNKHSGKWEENQYLIKFNNNYEKLENYGQTISLKLPFSKDKIYNEYLINIDYLKDEFKKCNLILEINSSFSEYFNDYIKHQTNNLSASDKIFTSLYHYYSFYKVK